MPLVGMYEYASPRPAFPQRHGEAQKKAGPNKRGKTKGEVGIKGLVARPVPVEEARSDRGLRRCYWRTGVVVLPHVRFGTGINIKLETVAIPSAESLDVRAR